MNKIILSLMNRIFNPSMGNPEMTEEYFERFVTPHVERGRAAGMSQEDLDKGWDYAMKNASPHTFGPYPGGLFRDYVDGWIEENGQTNHDA